MEKTRFNFRVK